LKTRNFEKSAGGVLAWRQQLFSSTSLRQRPSWLIAFGALAMKAGEELSQIAGWKAGLAEPLRYKELYPVMERHLLEPEQADKPATPPTWSPT
jgi:hypothetical protein